VRSSWKGKFLTHDFDLFDNIEFYAEYDIFNSNLIIPLKLVINEFSAFKVYKGNKFEMVISSKNNMGFTLIGLVTI